MDIHAVQVKRRDFVARFLRATRKFRDECRRIARLAGTAVQNYDLFHKNTSYSLTGRISE